MKWPAIFSFASLLCAATLHSATVSLLSPLAMTNAAATGESLLPTISPDGRRVAFLSHAGDLLQAGGEPHHLNVFVRNVINRDMTLASVSASGSDYADGNCNYLSVSSNGQFVAFASEAANLVANDTNTVADVFVRDLASGVTHLISVSLDGTVPARQSFARGSTRPVITPDGRYVAFESLATNLVVGDTNTIEDVFLRDIITQTTELISIGASWVTGVPGIGVPGSFAPTLSYDGRRVGFVSTAANLFPGYTNRFGDIYVRDRHSNTTVWASADVRSFIAPSGGNYGCFGPALSDDGRYVAFMASASTQPGFFFLFRHDIDENETTLLASNVSTRTFPDISANGRYVAYDDGTNVYRWDALSGSNVLVNVQFADGIAAASGLSHSPVMTPDARHICFLSTGTNLVNGVSSPAAGQLQLYVRDMSAATTRLVSVALDGSESATSLYGVLPSISADGNLIGFDSAGSDLVEHDRNGASDVFLRNVGQGTTSLVSTRAPDVSSRTPPRHSLLDASSVAISSNGTVAVFTSSDGNYSLSDTNGLLDVFASHVTNGLVSSVSLPRPLGFDVNHIAHLPVISADGRYVLFYLQESSANPPETFFTSGGRNWLFRRDLITGTIDQVASDFTYSYVPFEGRRNPPSISADGNLIAYTVGEQTAMQVYLRDMSAGTNRLISISRFGTPGNAASFRPIFSLDSKWIVFESRASDLVNASQGPIGLYAHNLVSNSTLFVSGEYSTNAAFAAGGRYLVFQKSGSTYRFDFETLRNPESVAAGGSATVSSDGRFVATAVRRNDGSANYDIFERDVRTGQGMLITSNHIGTALANGLSSSPAISRNGRYIVFQSTAEDLVPDDTNSVSDLFVRDRVLGVTMLISRNRNGTASGAGVSSRPVLAADGRTVVFHSNAGDIVSGDHNTAYDVFVLSLGSEDSDNDGLDDGWELVYFDGLHKDGHDDSDRDGRTDAEEYGAGTDPTDRGLAFTAISVAPSAGGPVTLLWASVAGRIYRVQYKANVDDTECIYLPGFITATGATASYVDSSPNTPRRFYRVVLAQ